MKLLVISHAGVLAVNRALFSTLAKQSQWDVRMVVPTAWKGDLIRDLAYAPDPSDGKMPVIPVPVGCSGSGSFFFFKKNIKSALGDWEPDLVFVDEEPWSLAALQIYWILRRFPKVFYTKQNLFKRLPPPFCWIQSWIFKKSVAAFSCAELVSQVLRQKDFNGKIIELPHSFDPQLFFPASSESERKQLRAQFELPLDRPVVAYVGRLSAEKGIEEWSKVIRNWDQNRAPCFFWTIGNGDQSNLPLGKHIAALKHDEVGQALRCVDLLVLPSRTEPNWKEQFGRILIEAAGSGAALAGSDSGEIPILIGKLKGGLVFKERDAADLAKKIETLVQNPKQLENFKQAGTSLAQSRYTHAAVALFLQKELATIRLN